MSEIDAGRSHLKSLNVQQEKSMNEQQAEDERKSIREEDDDQGDGGRWFALREKRTDSRTPDAAASCGELSQVDGSNDVTANGSRVMFETSGDLRRIEIEQEARNCFAKIARRSNLEASAKRKNQSRDQNPEKEGRTAMSSMSHLENKYIIPSCSSSCENAEERRSNADGKSISLEKRENKLDQLYFKKMQELNVEAANHPKISSTDPPHSPLFFKSSTRMWSNEEINTNLSYYLQHPIIEGDDSISSLENISHSSPSLDQWLSTLGARYSCVLKSSPVIFKNSLR